MSDRVFFLLVALGLAGGFVLVRQARGAVTAAADAVGEGARSLSDLTLAIPNVLTRSTIDAVRAVSPNERDPTRELTDDSFGANVFKLRVALFGAPDDFPQASREANPGLIGQLFD